MMLLEQMLMIGRLAEWVEKVLLFHNEEVEEKAQWEFYLHRIYDKSFEEFTHDAKQAAQPQLANMDEVETTVKRSLEVLETFNL